MSKKTASSFSQGLLRVLWNITCVLMMTSMVGLIAVYTEYYDKSIESGALFMPALGLGVFGIIVALLLPAFRWWIDRRSSSKD